METEQRCPDPMHHGAEPPRQALPGPLVLGTVRQPLLYLAFSIPSHLSPPESVEGSYILSLFC